MIEITEIKPNHQFIVEITNPRTLKDESTFLGLLDDLIDRDRFGIAIKVEGGRAFSPEAKKRLGLWFKQNKAVLKKKCFGFARIKTQTTRVERLTSKAMRLAIPCPYDLFETEEAAIQWLTTKGSAT
ncbi:MAG: hypothetical protein CL675_00440 [Bdellovibrionaceae bacterium]|nr:hypothetical protein [Pseudobdellovibrionaceae bacterium]